MITGWGNGARVPPHPGPLPSGREFPGQVRALRPVTSGASGLFSLSSRRRREERAGERRSYSSGWPLSPTLSPFVPHGEREKKGAVEPLVTGQGGGTASSQRDERQSRSR